MFSSLELPAAYGLRGTNIFTMDANKPQVEAVGVVHGRIVAVGSVTEVQAALPAAAPLIDVGHRMVLPGFTDSHIHYGYLVRKWSAVDLDGCGSLSEALDRVREHVEGATGTPSAWVDGHGWAAHDWGEQPTAKALDAVVGHRPAALTAKDGHALWVNSAALSLAGITRDTADPPGGVIERDAETGEPTGVLYEDAMKLVLNVMPEMEVDALAAAMRASFHRLHAQGITAIHCPELLSDWQAYDSLRQQGELAVRVTFMPEARQLEHLTALGIESGLGGEWLRFGQLKFFADGTLGSRTAAMLAPFEGEPANVGVVVCGGEELKQLVSQAAASGIAVAIHAIGDRGVREALDAIEHARRNDAGRLRHRIEHAQLVDPADIQRFARLGVVASMQPAHGAVDRENALKYWGSRVAHASPYRSLADAGAVLAFGSDAPFGLDLSDTSFSVLAGVHAAVTRRWVALDGDVAEPPQDYAPGQVLRLDEALAAYTVGPAFVGGEERWRGSLTVGHCADMVVLEENLYKVPVGDIPHVPVVATIVDGRVVYRR